MPSEISHGELKEDQERVRWEVNPALQGVLQRQHLPVFLPTTTDSMYVSCM